MGEARGEGARYDADGWRILNEGHRVHDAISGVLLEVTLGGGSSWWAQSVVDGHARLARRADGRARAFRSVETAKRAAAELARLTAVVCAERAATTLAALDRLAKGA